MTVSPNPDILPKQCGNPAKQNYNCLLRRAASSSFSSGLSSNLPGVRSSRRAESIGDGCAHELTDYSLQIGLNEVDTATNYFSSSSCATEIEGRSSLSLSECFSTLANCFVRLLLELERGFASGSWRKSGCDEIWEGRGGKRRRTGSEKRSRYRGQKQSAARLLLFSVFDRLQIPTSEVHFATYTARGICQL
jgi:hypothetical protein